MKINRLFSIAAATMMMVACSSEDTALKNTPAAGPQMQFTATIAAPGSGATTRTEYTEITSGDDAGTINVAWKENDEIAAIVINSENKYVKDVLTVSKVNTDGSATISGKITKPKDEALTVDLIYPASIVTVDDNGYSISFKKMSDGTTLDGTLKSIYENIDYRRADDCELTVSGEQATLTSAAKLESKLSIWKLTLQNDAETPAALSASKVTIVNSDGVAVASATLATAGPTAYLPVPATTGDICITATIDDNDYFYMKEDVALATGKYYQSTVQMTKGAHLAFLSADYEAKDGAILTGTLASNVKISIANNATVTLKDANINGSGTLLGNNAGITCEGGATIILEGENTVQGLKSKYPGIEVAESKPLTIMGSGSLDATGKGSAAGIGGGYQGTCGAITISGGTVTATGGSDAAGIGSGYQGSCGTIIISGGTVTATGGMMAAGIGSGYSGSCGNITITKGVTSVKATKGNSANSIGAGRGGTCGTVTIGCTLDTDGNPVGGTTGAIADSPYEYSAPPALTLTTPAVGQVIGSDGKNYATNATLPTGVTKVAMIAYLDGSHGLAIALADEGSMNWATAKSTCEAKTPAFTGGTWKLPSEDDWKNMFQANGGSNESFNGLNGALATAGGNGSRLREAKQYWSSRTRGEASAYSVYLRSSAVWDPSTKTSTFFVRAVLAF